MSTAQLPRVDTGAVLAGVKATPSGWPPASPDPRSGGAHRQRPGAGSNKFRSPRFQGIARTTRQQRITGSAE
jgi:hypothetical protein